MTLPTALAPASPTPCPVEEVMAAARPGAHRPPPFLSLLYRDTAAKVGLGIVISLVLAVIFAPYLAPHSPYDIDVTRRLAPPSAHFPLGTDNLGRDILSRLLYGGRLTLWVVLIASLLIGLIGTTMGILAGYFRGAVDTVISRLIELMLTFPTFLLALAITAVLGPGLTNVMTAVILSWWAGLARLVRSAVLGAADRPYAEAARALGASNPRILFSHLLPNIAGPLAVFITLQMGGVLLGISSFSFLGLTVQPPEPEWGAMLSEGRNFIAAAPHMIWAPGVALFLIVLGCNLVADGLRDSLDPTTQ